MKALFRWIRKKFIQSIQIRLTSYFLLSLVPLMAIGLYTNFQSQHILGKQVDERTRTALMSALEYIDLTMQNMEELSKQIASDRNLKELLNHQDNLMSFPTISDFQKVLLHLSNIQATNRNMSQISIFQTANELMLSSQSGGKRTEDYREQSWYRETLGAQGSSILLISDQNRYSVYQEIDPIFNTNSITLMRLMDSLNQEAQLNLLMITINKQKLLTFAKNLLQSDEEQVYLYTADGRLVGGSSKDGAVLQRDQDADDRLRVTRVQSPSSGWSLVLLQNEQNIYSEMVQQKKNTYFIIGVSLVLAILISWGVYRGISSPLGALTSGMKRFRQGQLHTRLSNKREDEFGYVTESFNQMAEEHEHLIENIYEQQLMMAKTELKFLQSQINPHFLYNTLDSVYVRAKNYEADDLSEMIFNLSKYYRLSLGKGKDYVSVQETLEHLYFYLRVQQLRFTDRFTVQLDADDSCKPLPLLKLLLQPLVENAIIHGLEKKTSGGELQVSCTAEEGNLKLQVQDNGKGIGPARLAYIREQLGMVSAVGIKQLLQSGQRREDLYGLWNVKARLILYYGEHAGMEIDSEEKEGTAVTLYIPLERCYQLIGGEKL